MTRLPIILIMCFMVLFVYSEVLATEQESSPTVDEIIQKASEALAGINDAKMTIEHFDSDGRLLAREEVEYKAPGMVRVEGSHIPYGASYTYVSDGNTDWLYETEDNLVTKSELPKESWRQPNLKTPVSGISAPPYLILSISPKLIEENHNIEYEGIKEINGRKTHFLKLIEKPEKRQQNPPRAIGERTARGDTFVYAVRNIFTPESETGTFLRIGIDADTGTIVALKNQRSYYYGAEIEAARLKEFGDGIHLPVKFIKDDPYVTMGNLAKLGSIVINAGIPDDRFTFEPPSDAIVFDAGILKDVRKNIPIYEEKIKSAPEDPALHHALVRLYDRGTMDYSTRQSKKLPHLRKLVQLRPNMVTAQSMLSSTLSAMKLHKEAAEYAQKIVELKPDMAVAYIRLARVYMQMDRLEEALAHLQKAAELAPALYEFQYLAAEVYEKMGRTADAIQQYKQIIKLDSDGPMDLDYQRARMADKLVAISEGTELDQLISECQKKLTEEPGNIYLHKLVGDAYDKAGNREKTVESYQKLLNLILEGEMYKYPLDYRISRKIKSLGMYDEIIPLYEKQAELTTGNIKFGAQRELMGIYARNGKIDECLATYKDIVKQTQANQLLYTLRENGGNEFLKSLQKKLEESSDDVRLYRLLGDINSIYVFDRPNPAEAIAMYNRAIELAPDDPDLHLALAKVYSQQGDAEKAIESLKNAVGLKPDELYYRAYLAYAYNSFGDHHEAINIGKALVVEHHESSPPHGVLATAYLNAGMNTEAIAEYEKALEMAVDKSQYGDGGFFQMGMARAYEEMGDGEKADELYDMAGNLMQSWDRMQLYTEKGAFDRLKKYAIRKIRTGEDWEKQQVIQNLTQVLSRQGTLGELTEVFETGIKENPDDAGNYLALGEIYKQQNENDKAIEMLENAMQLSPNNDRLFSSLGEVYMRQRMFAEAAAAYDKAIKLQPGNTYLYSQLAGAYAGSGQIEEILKVADRLKNSGDMSGHSYMTLGDVYMAGQFYKEAVAAYKKGIGDRPGEPYFQEKLLRCYQVAGMTEEAQKLQAEMGGDTGYAASAVPTIKPAPNFALKTLFGEEIKLSDLKDKMVILNFFATWNPMCRKESQILEELYKAHKDNGVIVIGASIDNDENLVKSFAKSLGITYPMAISAEELFADYRAMAEIESKAIPTTFIINKGGFLSETHVSAQSKEVYEKDISRFLK